MDHSNQSNYEYTEVSTYTKVETVVHKGAVSSTSSTRTTHTKCTASPLLGKSVPRYKPNSTVRAPDNRPNTEVSKHATTPKPPHFPGVDIVHMTSETSRRKVTFAEIGNKPVAKAVQPCTEKPKAEDVEPKKRAQKVPAAEPPRKATQKVAVKPRLTTAAKMTTEIVKLCEIMVPHSETLVTCLGDTSSAKAVGKGTEVTSSLCRCRLISNLRSAGGKVTENLRLLTLRACNCQAESKVLILPSTHTGGIVCDYKVTVTKASSGDSYFEIRPDDSVGRSPDAGSKLSFVGSRTSGAHVEVSNDIGRHNRIVGGAPGAPTLGQPWSKSVAFIEVDNVRARSLARSLIAVRSKLVNGLEELLKSMSRLQNGDLDAVVCVADANEIGKHMDLLQEIKRTVGSIVSNFSASHVLPCVETLLLTDLKVFGCAYMYDAALPDGTLVDTGDIVMRKVTDDEATVKWGGDKAYKEKPLHKSDLKCYCSVRNALSIVPLSAEAASSEV
ncbi:hypothetical protein PCANC_18059 [Puccinia coronata f. sp. avenae]|uniref:Uncharacterized protein n=1 Tax=Puccinia coronata f. sp. avenae TaxID=200324 RepID=A0A2N5UJ41_9BASI|nr:hypothetical protein PCANC_18059 [Puccinia coronata f. sp. avenae]